MPVEFDEFRPLDGTARFLRFLLLLSAVVALVATLSDLMEVQLLSRVVAGESLSTVEAEANDSRQFMIAVVRIPVLAATMIAFFTWFYRSHKNLGPLGATGLKYSPGWAIGGFFVPILSLYRPLQVMREVWNGSTPEPSTALSTSGVFSHYGDEQTPGKVKWWWGLFLVSALLGQLTFRLSLLDEPSLRVLVASSWLSFVANAVDLPGLLVTVSLVQAITARQNEQWRHVIATPPPAPARWGQAV
jgi:hypothetical protein